MKYKSSALLYVAILVLFGYIVVLSMRLSGAEVDIITEKQVISLNTEIADSPDEWSRGLMFRDSLAENSGMLFVFPDERIRVFWMKNTLIPLDIIFVSSNLMITDVKENFYPCAAEPCETYVSKPAKYAIEVNAGLVEKYGIKAGNAVKIS